MSAEITIVGNLGMDPELRFTAEGTAVARFSVGVTKRILRGDEWVDGETSWYDCSAWRQLGEHCAESLSRGMRVIVTGVIEQRTYEKDGETRYAWGVSVRNVGVDLTFGTAEFTKAGAKKQEPPAKSRSGNTRAGSRSR